MKTIELKNSFHRTRCKISAQWGDTAQEAWMHIQYEVDTKASRKAKRLKARIEKALCGMSGCRCRVVDN